MEIEEHFYYDDPNVGPPDARTNLQNVHYFFIGNGQLTAVVQICSSDKASPMGLLIMHPERFGPKREALSFDPEHGLKKTMLTVTNSRQTITPKAKKIDGSWDDIKGVPLIKIEWGTEQVGVTERFLFADRKKPRLLREIRLTNRSQNPLSFTIQTGVLKNNLKKEVTLPAHNEQTYRIAYTVTENNYDITIELEWIEAFEPDQDAISYWQNTATCSFDSPLLNHLFTASKYQLQANIAQSGCSDASIWQYNLEWVRDQSMIAIGLTVSGQFERARQLLDRMFSKFVTNKGDTVDSSRERPNQEVELDQNGELLFALRFYFDWTGDLDMVKKHWGKVKAVANFPLQSVFRHPETMMFHNEREYWERHSGYGITDGMELMYQFYVSMGLFSAAYLADILGNKAEAQYWRRTAQEIKSAMLHDPKYALIDDGHFIKRRKTTGEIQTEVHVDENSPLPKDTPLREDTKHFLNPDTSSALPIAWEFINSSSELAKNTLQQIEQLWNQRWESGGYCRYHVTSEPDSPGGWPFPSLFVARAYFEMANDEKIWRVLNWLNQIPGAMSGAWFEFHGGYRPIPPCPQIGITPWTWAEMLILFVHHILGVRPSRDRLSFRPRLLQGTSSVNSLIRLRDNWLQISLQTTSDKKKTGFWVDGEYIPHSREGILIDMPQKDMHIEGYLPE